MKKVASLLIVLLLCVGTSMAQKGVMKVEPSIVVAFPQSGTSTGFGLNGTFFYGINEQLDLTGTLGYITWSYDGWDGSTSTVPLLFGGRYSFGDQGGFTPYASAELGFHFTSYSYETPEIPGWTDGYKYSASSTEFGFGIGGGGYFKLGNITFDGNLQFNKIGSGDYFSLEIGALFGI